MEYLDATRYLAWLGDKPDNEPNRVKWAIKAMERRKKLIIDRTRRAFGFRRTEHIRQNYVPLPANA